MKFFIYVIIILFTLSSKSYAYLDPGSAGIIQIILAVIMGAFACLLIYWNKFQNFLDKIFKKKKADEKKYSQ